VPVFIPIFAALLASLAGLGFAYGAWKRHTPGWRAVAALLCWTIATAIWIGSFGTEVGIPLTLETAALAAFVFILSRIERRGDRRRPDRASHQEARTSLQWLRGTGRAVIAGPLGLVAALGVGIGIATLLPVAEQTRLILGGLIVPSVWCGAIAWAMCDRRLIPQAIAFTAIGGIGFGAAFLRAG
jgi:hypothetical protein